MSAICTIESRIGSTRLPGKALYPFFDTTVLGSVIANARAARTVGRIIVCTSTEPRDQVIADHAARFEVEVFRGSEEDVAGRLAEALKDQTGPNVFLTGDNPVVTSDLIDMGVRQFFDTGADYLCSTHMKYCDWWTDRPVLPKGLSVQVADIAFFQDAVETNIEPHYRQHSTMVMYGRQKPQRRYRALVLPFDAEGWMPLSYTIDTPDEYREMGERWQARPLTLDEVLKRPEEQG